MENHPKEKKEVVLHDMKKASDLKSYILNESKKYEKQGFILQAAENYKIFDREIANKIYLAIAKKAEKYKFWPIAADIYEALGDVKKARFSWNKFADHLKANNGPPVLIKEALNRSQPEPKEYQRRRELSRKISAMQREGKFSDARRAFVQFAKTEEKEGNLEFAAKLYYNACRLKDAERVWKKQKLITKPSKIPT